MYMPESYLYNMRWRCVHICGREGYTFHLFFLFAILPHHSPRTLYVREVTSQERMLYIFAVKITILCAILL